MAQLEGPAPEANIQLEADSERKHHASAATNAQMKKVCGSTLMNMDIKDKNEKILELLENIEDLKVQVYSRDKSIDLQQSQIGQLMEDLREAKQFEHQCKAL